MKSSQLNRSRLVVGTGLIVSALLMLLFVKDAYSTAGAIGMGVLGIMSIAVS
jgi:hypothetical protein